MSIFFNSIIIDSYAESNTDDDSELQSINKEVNTNYIEKLKFEDDERQWINDQIQKELGRNSSTQNQIKGLTSIQQMKEAMSVQETSDRDLSERLIRLKDRELNNALTKSNEELVGLNLRAAATETGIDESKIQDKLDSGLTLQEGTSISKSEEGSRGSNTNKPRTIVNLSEEAKSEITSDLGTIDLTKTNDFLAKALPPKPVKPNLELLKIGSGEAPFKVNHDSENISTISGSLSLAESDLTLPGRNGHSFSLTRNYDSGSSQLYEADVKEHVSSVPIYNINTNYKVDVYGTVYYINYNYHVLNNKYKCSDNSLVLQESSWYDPASPIHEEFSSISERSEFYNSLERYKVENGPDYCATADRYYLHQFYLVTELTSAYKYLFTDSVNSEDGPYLYTDAQDAVSYFNSQKGKLAFSESDAGYDYKFIYDSASLINTPIDSYNQVSYSNDIVDSKDQKRAPLGIGWTWNIPYLTFDDGTFVHLANGSSYKVESGVLKGYPWKDLTLAADTSVTVNGLKSAQVLKNVLTGEKQYFDDKGKVLQISDSYNNNTTFKYADIAPYNTLLTEITDAIGNKITIQY